jgi:uncharacterized protein
LTVYLDASVVVSLFVNDVHTDRAQAWLARGDTPVLSRWTIAEFSSALARLRRLGVLDYEQQRGAEEAFDAWMVLLGPPVAITDQDFIEARYLCRGDGAIRTPDALHLCVVQRLGISFLTFDAAQADVARRQGVDVVAG